MWWQAKDHPIWPIAGRLVNIVEIGAVIGAFGFVAAYVGAENLDAKDVISHVFNTAAGIAYGQARSKRS